MARIVRLEYPLLKCNRIDLDAHATIETDALSLVRELESLSPEDQIAFRGGHRYVQRLVRKNIVPGSRFEINSEKCYLITGGTGYLGMMTAK